MELSTFALWGLLMVLSALLCILIRSGLMRLVAPLYRIFGYISEDILGSDHAPKEAHAYVLHLRNNMFNGWHFFFFALSVIPFSIYGLFKHKPFEFGRELNLKLVALTLIWWAGLSAQNPLIGLLVILELIIVAPLELLKSGVITVGIRMFRSGGHGWSPHVP